MKINLSKLDKAELLPFKEKMIPYGLCFVGVGPFYPKNHIYPWVKATQIIENNNGKSFDMAFSYFCKKVDKHQQCEFLDYFYSPVNWHTGFPLRGESKYHLDTNKNIIINKYKYKKTYKIYSHDFRMFWISKRKNLLTGDFEIMYKRPEWSDYHNWREDYTGSYYTTKSEKVFEMHRLTQKKYKNKNKKFAKKQEKLRSKRIYEEAIYHNYNELKRMNQLCYDYK